MSTSITNLVTFNSALNGTDYDYATQTVTFLPEAGDNDLLPVDLFPLEDARIEGDEQLVLQLVNLVSDTSMTPAQIIASSDHSQFG